MVTCCKLLCRYNRSIIQRPTVNHRVELINHFFLWKGLSFLYYLPQFLQMALDSFFTRRDDRLEAKRFPFGILSCMGFPYGELANGESQQVEPYIALVFFQAMRYPCFTWFPF